jgi:rare lipoprotein A (peptidoglycan hydrolase)
MRHGGAGRGPKVGELAELRHVQAGVASLYQTRRNPINTTNGERIEQGSLTLLIRQLDLRKMPHEG